MSLSTDNIDYVNDSISQSLNDNVWHGHATWSISSVRPQLVMLLGTGTDITIKMTASHSLPLSSTVIATAHGIGHCLVIAMALTLAIGMIQ